ALRRLTCTIRFRFWRLKALRKDNEMMNQALHVAHDLVLRGRNKLRRIGHEWALWQLVKALLDDPRALPHLFHSHPVPVVGVAVLPDRHFPVDLVVNAVGLRFADVVGHSRSAQDGTAAPEVDRVFPGDHADLPRY